MVAINIFAAETTEAAERLATSQHRSFLSLIRNTPSQIKPPVDSMETIWTPEEKELVMSRLSGSIIGDKAKVKTELSQLIERTQADEIMVSAIIYDHKERLRSYEITAEVNAEIFGNSYAAGNNV